jgi:DNA ligase-1
MNKLLLPIKAPNAIIPFTDPRIRWPMLASVKYDGFRMVAICGERFITPSGKDHVNKFIPHHFEQFFTYCKENKLVADGELWSPQRTFHELQSLVRSENMILPGDVKYYVFDLMTLAEWNDIGQCRIYAERMQALCHILQFHNVELVLQVRMDSASAAEILYEQILEEKHEGIMLRSPFGTYKHGRCTHIESHLFKFKNFVTQDGWIVGFEQMERLNDDAPDELDEAGYKKKTYRAEHHTPVDALGAFHVTQDCKTSFKVTPGRGFTMQDRARWWDERFSLRGQGIEFVYMPHGTKDKPRSGRLVRFRPDKPWPDGQSIESVTI